MAALRSPEGCPWDREQDHQTLRWHAVEEVYELLDAIEAHDDLEMAEELGDLLLQVVFHAQLARERKAFDFDAICQRLADKLVRRHPHVFGDVQVKDVDQVWANWESIKKAEKAGSRHERKSALDGVPRHLPALMRAQKLLKKAAKAGLEPTAKARPAGDGRRAVRPGGPVPGGRLVCRGTAAGRTGPARGGLAARGTTSGAAGRSTRPPGNPGPFDCLTTPREPVLRGLPGGQPAVPPDGFRRFGR
jgi:NTP pyrophosphatase (non-canonical NTP hydrolase)